MVVGGRTVAAATAAVEAVRAGKLVAQPDSPVLMAVIKKPSRHP